MVGIFSDISFSTDPRNRVSDLNFSDKIITVQKPGFSVSPKFDRQFQHKMNPSGSFNVPFSNQLPDRLDRELSRANELGIIPIKIGDPKFDPVINQGTIKWAVTIEGELVVIPKFVGGEEIPHTVLTQGQPVLAAGEAEIVGERGEYILLEINNYSGHFQPTLKSLDIGKTVFRELGIDTSNADEKKFE